MNLEDFRVTLSTGLWDIMLRPVSGLACYARTIYVDSDEPYITKEFLSTLCHETIHASDKDMNEKKVERLSRDIAEVLWKAGYRIPRETTKKRTKKKVSSKLIKLAHTLKDGKRAKPS